MDGGSRSSPSLTPTTLSQATFKGWMDIMLYAAVDSRGGEWGARDVAGE